MSPPSFSSFPSQSPPAETRDPQPPPTHTTSLCPERRSASNPLLSPSLSSHRLRLWQCTNRRPAPRSGTLAGLRLWLACGPHASSVDMDLQDCACGLPAAPTPAPPTWIAREVRRQPCIAAVAPMSRGAGRSRRCRTAETAGKRLCGRRAARLMCVSGHPRRQHCVTALPAAGFEVATNGCQPMPGDAADYSTTCILRHLHGGLRKGLLANQIGLTPNRIRLRVGD